MTTIELLADSLQRNLEMLKSTLADFSDADMLVRPVPAANHAAWQVGHLASSEARLLGAIKNTAPALPAGWEAKFTKETASKDDPSFFPKKQELLDQLAGARQATIQWVRTLKESDFGQPGPERMRQFVPTIGHIATMMPAHLAMHMGQLQVIRRKLGKPILF